MEVEAKEGESEGEVVVVVVVVKKINILLSKIKQNKIYKSKNKNHVRKAEQTTKK